MVTQNPRPAWGAFIKTFNDIARNRHRYEVFRDFVTMAAIAMHTGSPETRGSKRSTCRSSAATRKRRSQHFRSFWGNW